MKRSWLLLFVVMASLFLPGVRAAEVEDYSATLRIFQDAPLTQDYFSGAYGYAVFPKVGKGAAGVGVAYGRGQVYRAGIATGICRLYQLSLGLQLGGQAYSEIIFFQDQRAYDEFTRGSFEFDAGVSAVAITAGAQARTGTTGTSAGASLGPKTGTQLAARYVKGLAVFVHSKGGLMYEAAVGGQKFKFEPL